MYNSEIKQVLCMLTESHTENAKDITQNFASNQEHDTVKRTRFFFLQTDIAFFVYGN